MKKLVDPYEFDDREDALLEAWDKHNVSSGTKNEHEAEFEARLVAAYRKAEEAALRITESEDDAICRRMAADASLDDETPEPRSGAKPPSPASNTSAKPARGAPRLSSFHFRLAAVVLASAALGALLVILTMWQHRYDVSSAVDLRAERTPTDIVHDLDSALTSSSKEASRMNSGTLATESKLDDACRDLDLFTHGGARPSSSSCIRSPTDVDSQTSSNRDAVSVRGMKNISPAPPPADAARAPHTPPDSHKWSTSASGNMMANKSSETRVGSESSPSPSFRASDTPPQTVTHLDDVTETIVVTGSLDRTLPPSAQDARDTPEKVPAKPSGEAVAQIDSAGHYDQGPYATTESLYGRELAIREKAFGPNHPAVATDLNNFAELYQAQGAYAKAEALYVRALAIRAKALGPNHPGVAESLKNLAMLYQAQGAYAKAEPFALRALAICERTLGPNHPTVAESMNNLALLYQDRGAYEKAEPLFVRALAIDEKALGPNHPSIVASLNNIALLYQRRGAYEKAEPLLVRALAIDEAQKSNHPNVALSMNNLATLYARRGAYDKAESLLWRAAEIRERQLGTELMRLPESRERALMALLEQDTDGVVSFHADAMSNSTAARDLALTTVLRRKGRIFDSLVDNETRIRRHLPPSLRWMFDQLSQARTDLAAHMYPSGGLSKPADRVATDVARARIDELETKLSAASAEFRTEAESVSLAKVRAHILNDTALVEFAKYRRFDRKQPEPFQLREERYVAYILTARGAVQWVALGKGAPIESQVDAVLAAIRDNAPLETTRAALQRLDALVLAPVRAKLPSVSHLIVAPDGKLNLVPFEALVDPQGHYALEDYLISYVTTGRDLLRIAATRTPKSPAVIVADPDYGPPPALGPGTMALTPLPDAQAEAADLQPYFPAAPITGANATKAALASLSAPAIIHIATHGFYARDVPSGRPAPGVLRDMARGFYLEADASSSGAPSSRSDDLADGLDRAGLALAGANQGVGGIVTAREIAGFDWWGTQLVVLSACETGVGAASSGDGVYGLRRALVLAGAASQVVSLWNVEDASTRQLMREFYGNLAHGVGRAEALRQAKLFLLHQPQYEHPFYWAPFIAAGDWRALPKGILAPRKAAP